MLSVRTDKPVDVLIVAILTAVDAAMQRLGLRYFIAGAMARDIMLLNVFGLDPSRATRDVDFGVAVESWDQFQQIKSLLVASGSFVCDGREPHRLQFRKGSDSRGVPVDFIPFQGVERSGSFIAWPPDMKVVMNVTGYSDALQAALPIEIGPGIIVPVVSIPNLTALKLFAWIDRGREDAKDALDFVTLMRTYAYAGNTDRLYGNEIEVLAATGYDLEMAAARLLGKDVAIAVSATTRDRLSGMMSDQQTIERLVTHMAKALIAKSNAIEAAERFLGEFKAGLNLINVPNSPVPGPEI